MDSDSYIPVDYDLFVFFIWGSFTVCENGVIPDVESYPEYLQPENQFWYYGPDSSLAPNSNLSNSRPSTVAAHNNIGLGLQGDDHSFYIITQLSNLGMIRTHIRVV